MKDDEKSSKSGENVRATEYEWASIAMQKCNYTSIFIQIIYKQNGSSFWFGKTY